MSPPDRPERIGVLGGTFDPIHVGHLVAAVNVRHALQLDRVLLVVANVPWQKSARRAVTDAEDRFALVAAAVGDVDGVEASRMEIDRGGVSYTADTLEQLAAERTGAELFVVVGRDVAGDLDTWERVDQVRAQATLVVVNRFGFAGSGPAVDPDWRVVQVEIPNLEISSTDLRARIADGRPLDYLVPEAAVRCIRERGLYAGSR
jgi:nicotinate-nucleotide adenylyltransferase